MPKRRVRRRPVSATRLSEIQAANHVGMSESFLRKLRREGRGPTYLKIGGAIRYDVADLDRWIDTCRVRGEADDAN